MINETKKNQIIIKYIIGLAFFISSAQSLSTIIEFNTKSGEVITISQTEAQTKDILFINIVSYRGTSREYEELIPKIVGAGINVWSMDLVDSYMLPPTPNSFNKIPTSEVSEVIREARKSGYKNIFLYSISKSSNFALKVAYDYQSRYKDGAIKGHIMHVPEVWTTNHKTSKTTINEIAKSSNLPIYLIMTEFGTKYHLRKKIATILETGGSPVFVHKIKGVRSGFHVRPKAHLTEYDLKIKETLPSIYKMATRLLLTTEYPDIKNQEYKDQQPRQYSTKLVKRSGYERMPPTSLPTFNGKHLDLGKYIGKKLLINFWASWCRSCAIEIPSMTRLKARFKDRIAIVTINIGEDKQLIQEFKNKVPFDFPIMMDVDGETMREWGVFVYPTNFLIDERGYIVYTYTGSIEWDSPEIINVIKSI